MKASTHQKNVDLELHVDTVRHKARILTLAIVGYALCPNDVSASWTHEAGENWIHDLQGLAFDLMADVSALQSHVEEERA